VGDLTKRNDTTRNKIITELHELYRFLATPGVEVTNLGFVRDDVVWLSSKLSAEEYVPNPTYTNEFIGAYVTADSRIHLYIFSLKLSEDKIVAGKTLTWQLLPM